MITLQYYDKLDKNLFVKCKVNSFILGDKSWNFRGRTEDTLSGGPRSRLRDFALYEIGRESENLEESPMEEASIHSLCSLQTEKIDMGF